MNQSERRNFLIQSLLEESREYRGMQIPTAPGRDSFCGG